MRTQRRKFAPAIAFACFIIFCQFAAQAAQPPATGNAGEAVTASMAALGVEVPLRLTRNGHFLLPVMLGDAEFPFMLDTASARSIITPETYAKLKTKSNAKRPMRVEGIGGGFKASLVEIGTLSVGRYRRKEMSAIVLDLKLIQENAGERISGILGMDFLKNYNMRVDLEARTLRLYACDEGGDVGALVGVGGMEKVAYNMQHGGLIMVTVRLAGASVTGLLDTGSAHTIMNWSAAEAAGVSRKTKGVEKLRTRMTGVDKKAIELFSYQFKQIEVGDSRYGPSKVSIADLPLFETLGFKERPAMIIGADFLKDRVFFIAQNTGHLYLSRGEERNGEVAENQDGK